MRGIVLAADLLEAFVGEQRGMVVVAQAARVFVDQMAHGAAARGELGLHLEQLVHLFLVLDHGEFDLGVFQHIDHLVGDGVLVERHGHAAERLRGGHRPVETRAVVTHHGQVHAAPEPKRGQPAGERAHLARGLRPAVCLPDPEILLAMGRMIRPLRGVRQQASREGRCRRFLHRCLLSPRGRRGHAGYQAAGPVAILGARRRFSHRIKPPSLVRSGRAGSVVIVR
ncbi:hypothetical protein D3C86_1586870 [compost metagenome]